MTPLCWPRQAVPCGVLLLHMDSSETLCPLLGLPSLPRVGPKPSAGHHYQLQSCLLSTDLNFRSFCSEVFLNNEGRKKTELFCCFQFQTTLPPHPPPSLRKESVFPLTCVVEVVNVLCVLGGFTLGSLSEVEAKRWNSGCYCHRKTLKCWQSTWCYQYFSFCHFCASVRNIWKWREAHMLWSWRFESPLCLPFVRVFGKGLTFCNLPFFICENMSAHLRAVRLHYVEVPDILPDSVDSTLLFFLLFICGEYSVSNGWGPFTYFKIDTAY